MLALALALREQQPLAAVGTDLDHFKLSDDDHGHPAGDGLLATFGRLLREKLRQKLREQLPEQLRSSDIDLRYGGREFCLLMCVATAGV